MDNGSGRELHMNCHFWNAQGARIAKQLGRVWKMVFEWSADLSHVRWAAVKRNWCLKFNLDASRTNSDSLSYFSDLSAYAQTLSIILCRVRTFMRVWYRLSNTKLMVNCYFEICACTDRTRPAQHVRRRLRSRIGLHTFRRIFSKLFPFACISERSQRPVTLRSVRFATELNWRMAPLSQDTLLHQWEAITLWPMTVRSQSDDQARVHIRHWTKRTAKAISVDAGYACRIQPNTLTRNCQWTVMRRWV